MGHDRTVSRGSGDVCLAEPIGKRDFFVRYARRRAAHHDLAGRYRVIDDGRTAASRKSTGRSSVGGGIVHTTARYLGGKAASATPPVASRMHLRHPDAPATGKHDGGRAITGPMAKTA